jgi:nicotinate-nucleotide pyrophosphorylase (carboxylating)
MIIDKFINETLAEDIGRGDLFSLVSKSFPIKGVLLAKSNGIFSGKLYGNRLAYLQNFKITWFKNDGDSFQKGDILAEIFGESHTILTIERTLLNIVLHSSSIATETNKYVKIASPYKVKILDTRKTKPLLRSFEKYSTRVGGAVNHRMGLDDSLMLKDTHLKTIDNLQNFIKEARKQIPFTAKIEVESESFEDVKKAMESNVDIVMCDNMLPNQLIEIVKFRDKYFPHITLEASGNITLDNLEQYAKSGVDAISSGSIIHQAKWLDISLKIDV